MFLWVVMVMLRFTEIIKVGKSKREYTEGEMSGVKVPEGLKINHIF